MNRKHPIGNFRRRVFFRPTRAERNCRIYKARIWANKNLAHQFWMTPLEYRKYWNELNSGLWGPCNCVTSFLKWKRIKHI
jgi:hypothetical protein